MQRFLYYRLIELSILSVIMEFFDCEKGKGTYLGLDAIPVIIVIIPENLLKNISIQLVILVREWKENSFEINLPCTSCKRENRIKPFNHYSALKPRRKGKEIGRDVDVKEATGCYYYWSVYWHLKRSIWLSRAIMPRQLSKGVYLTSSNYKVEPSKFKSIDGKQKSATISQKKLDAHQIFQQHWFLYVLHTSQLLTVKLFYKN